MTGFVSKSGRQFEVVNNFLFSAFEQSCHVWHLLGEDKKKGLQRAAGTIKGDKTEQ